MATATYAETDFLGGLAGQLQERSERAARRRLRAAARADSSATRRFSADQLRELGVDETFLEPANQLEATDEVHVHTADASEYAFQSIAFVSCEGTTRVEHGAIVHTSSSSSSTLTCVGREEQQPGWSAKRMQSEYGLGYSLLVSMGYDGGGRVPLAAVKRQARVGLQDDEDLALDPRFRQRKRRRNQSEQARAMRDSSEGVEELIEDDDEEDSLDAERSHLRRTLRLELKSATRNELSLTALARRPKVRRAVAERPEVGRCLEKFLKCFIKAEMPELEVRRSLSSAWRSLSGTNSSASWAQSSHRECVISLRQQNHQKEHGGRGESSQSSSSDSETVVHEELPDENQEVLHQQGCQCHGCGSIFGSRLLLRQHIIEKLAMRTTSDPTDLTARFDAEHNDRQVLEKVAENCSATGPLRCHACGYVETKGFLSLLDHFLETPKRRVEHQRILQLLAEILLLWLKEPRPEKEKGSNVQASSDLKKFLEYLSTDSDRTAHQNFEDSILGPEEEDIFGVDAGVQPEVGPQLPCQEASTMNSNRGPRTHEPTLSWKLYGPEVPENPV
eukprot:TRINITY_DN31932_c0_g1_i1.p1 TRINITY_DN31932_c0_g1~~TRINITY_DN31932_c0_g1_i1.p1  ORF type:complete len:583 (-),score=104.48 TRINITY_DN31932_c0_g1_i1:199-1884(-)